MNTINSNPNVYTEQVNTIPIFFDGQKKVSPSEISSELKLTTEERYARLIKSNRSTNKKKCSFEAIPNIIIFQNFKPGLTYNLPLVLKNIDQVSKVLILNWNASPTFDVQYSSDKIITRTAPGMSIHFNVKFTPDLHQDFEHKINFKIDDGQDIEIPLIAIGPRPMLNLPDQITFTKCGVNIINKRELSVYNYGNFTANVCINTKEPFYVTPKVGVIAPGTSINIVLQFKSPCSGIFEDYLAFIFENKEELYIKLSAKACILNIQLQQKYIQLEDTYIGLKSSEIVRLVNSSDHIVKFHWKCYDSKEREDKEKICFSNKFDSMRDYETKRSVKLTTLGVTDNEIHALAEQRLYDDETEILDEELFLFKNHIFTIEPLVGEIWPHASCEMLIIFSPDKVTQFSTEAYCDVTGLEKRLKLEMNGNGQGPNFDICMTIAKAECIYLYAVHFNEIVVRNKGNIPGEISFIKENTVFGGEINCTPQSLHLEPGECKRYMLSFSSSKEGEFIEDIKFIIKESGQILKIIFEGIMICPELTFVEKEINFGNIPLGYPISKEIHIMNTTWVAVNFTPRIVYDGTQEALKCSDLLEVTNQVNDLSSVLTGSFSDTPPACNDWPQTPVQPREITVQPLKAVVEPQNQYIITVTLLPNLIRTGSSKICLDLWNVESKSSDGIPIRWTCYVPSLFPDLDKIRFNFCFIGYPYTRTLQLTNINSACGLAKLVVDNITPSDSGLSVFLNPSEFYIAPNSSITVTIKIITTSFGVQNATLGVVIFGKRTPVKICNILCHGQGPVVSLSTKHLAFGECTLLKVIKKELILTNDSPIPTQFQIKLNNHKSVWSVEPTTGFLLSDTNQTLIVNIYLRDRGAFKDTLFVEITDNYKITCELSAVGVGTSIVIKPDLDTFHYLYTNILHRLELKVKNKGSRLHYLSWSCSTDALDNSGKIPIQPNKPIEIKPTETDTYFNITPTRMKLHNDEVGSMIIEAKCKESKEVDLHLQMVALLEKSSLDRDFVLLHMHLTFIDPDIKLYPHIITFRIDLMLNGSCFCHIKDKVHLKNCTPLSLTVDINVDAPFRLLDVSSAVMVQRYRIELPENSVHTVCVYFNCFDLNDYESYIVQGTMYFKYVGHNMMDKVYLNAEVNFPNISFKPNIIDFDCNPNDTYTEHKIEMINTSPLIAPFELKWNDCNFKVENIVSQKDDLPTNNNSQHNIICTNSKLNNTEITLEIESTIKLINNDDIDNDSNYLLNSSQYTTEKSNITSSDILDSDCKLRIITNILNNLSKPYYTNDESKLISLQSLKNCMKRKNDFNKMFNASPYCGILQPFEKQILTVSFHPGKYKTVETEMQCIIYGGPTESIKMKGMVSEIKYHINPDVIYLNLQMFCETCHGSVTLYNTGELGFFFFISLPDKKSSKNQYKPGWINIEPISGYLLPGDSKQLNVSYFPGIIGQFSEFFYIEIGYLYPVKICIEGCAVYPQIITSLPHYTMKINNDKEYIAISALTNKMEAKSSPNKYSSFIQGLQTAEKLITSSLHSYDCNKVDSDWEFVYADVSLPTSREIESIIDQFIINNYIKTHPNSLEDHISFKSKSIPGLYLPGYVVKFNSVIPDGKKINHTTTITNLGHFPAHISIKSFYKVNPATLGLEISLSSSTVYSTEYLNIILNANEELFQEDITKVRYLFYLEVKHGPKIPITIKAKIIKPHLQVIPEMLNFHLIETGQSKEMAILLQNENPVSITWMAKVIPKKIKRVNTFTIYPIKDKKKKQLPFKILKKHSGELKPNTWCFLNISYEPLEAGLHDYHLEITIKENPADDYLITLRGETLQPQILIHEKEILWPSTLPWFKTAPRYVKISNPCYFPVEYILSNFDKQLEKEEEVLKTLFTYYKTNTLHLPKKELGEQLSQTLYDFHTTIYEDIVKWVAASQKHSSLISETGSVSSDIEDVVLKNTSTRKRSNARSSSKHSNTSARLEQSRLSKSSVQKTINLKDINLTDYIDDIKSKKIPSDINRDPVKLAIKYKNTPKTIHSIDIKKSGVVLIFHGGPHTDYIELANKVATEFKFRVINIDTLIKDILLESTAIPSLQINDMINSTFNSTQQVSSNKKNINNMTTMLVNNLDELDPTERLEEKINTIQKMASLQSSSKKKKSSQSTKTSVAETKADNKKALNTTNTMLNISFDLLTELLKPHFMKFNSGVIIETLDSIFIKKPSELLSFILKLIGNIHYVHVIIIGSWFTKYDFYLKCKKEELEETINEMTVNKLEAIIDMEADSYENITSVDKTLFIKNILKPRVTSFKKRICELNERKIEKRKRELEAKTAKQSGKKKTVKKEKRKKETTVELLDEKSIVTNKSDKSIKTVISKKGSTQVVKLSPEEEQLKLVFTNFENDLTEILNIVQYWDIASMNVQDINSKDPKKKINTEKKSMLHDNDGVLCWIFDQSDPEKSCLENIISGLKSSSFTEAVSEFQDNLNEKIERKEKLFWIVHLSDISNYEKSTNDSFLLQSSNDILTNEVNTSIYNVSELIHLSNQIKEEETPADLKTRGMLQPGETIEFQVIFCPKNLGQFEHSYYIQIIGQNFKEDIYTIKCSGLCELPQINFDPYSLYTNVFQDLQDNQIQLVPFQDRGYYIKNACLDFGTIFIKHKDDPRFLRKNMKINLVNISHSSCSVTFDFIENISTFKYTPTKIQVKPGEKGILTVSALPSNIGQTLNWLCITTQDNPHVEKILLSVTGTQFNVSIEPQRIDFGRLPFVNNIATSEVEKYIMIINNSDTSIIWKLKDPKALKCTGFKLSTTESIVLPKSNFKLGIKYIASKSELLTDFFININIYDELVCHNILFTQKINLLIESFEIDIEVNYSHSEYKDLEFGVVPVEQNCQHRVILCNRGKYSVDFSIAPLELSEDFKHCQWEVYENVGILIPDQPQTLNFWCKAEYQINVKHLHVFNIDIYNNIQRTKLYTIPIKSSIIALYSKFEICSLNVNFGVLALREESNRTIVIKNIGEFPFTYSIKEKDTEIKKIDGKKMKFDSMTNLVNDKINSKKSADKPKSKGSSVSNKSKIPILFINCFELTNITGIVQPKDSATINVCCRPHFESGNVQTSIIANISESSPSYHKYPNIIKLEANVHEPIIEFNNIKKIFRESYVINDLTDFYAPKTIGSHTLYIKINNTLSFINTCLNCETKTRLHFYNPGPVNANIVSQLKSEYENVFTMKPEQCTILAYTECSVEITYKPLLIQAYKAFLEVQVEFSQNKFLVNIEGDSQVPQIKFINPEPVNDVCTLSFEPTLIGNISKCLFSFQNISYINSKVIVDIKDDSLNQFYITYLNKAESSTENDSQISEKRHCANIDLPNGQIANFCLYYEPQKVGSCECIVCLHIINNPFENISMKVKAEAINEFITVNGLDLNIETEENKNSVLMYTLNFGTGGVKTLLKKSFNICNHSQDTNYKFIFKTPDSNSVHSKQSNLYSNVSFIPSSGFLYPSQSKEIVALFESNEPVSIEKIFYEIELMKIEYLIDDTSEKEVIPTKDIGNSISSMRSNISVEEMINCEELNKNTEDIIKNLILKVSAIINYASYDCNVAELNFEDTLLFETNEKILTIFNPSNIPLEIVWSLSVDKSTLNSVTSNLKNSEENNKGNQNSNNYCLIKKQIRRKEPHPLTGKEHCVEEAFTRKSNIFRTSFIKNASFTSTTNIKDNLSFIISPYSTSIPPLQKCDFKITFKPQSVGSYQGYMFSYTPYLPNEIEELTITLYGNGKNPYYYFDFDPSDYLSANRRNKTSCPLPSISSNWKVFEFNCVGIKNTITRSFPIFNVTNENLEYIWTQMKIFNSEYIGNIFKCHKYSGSIEKNRYEEAVFSFYPIKFGIYEDVFTFNVEKYQSSTHLLIVANVKKPCIYFVKSVIYTKPTILGIDVSDNIILRNDSTEDLKFHFKQETLNNHNQILNVEPLKGSIGANSDMNIKITFSPKQINETIFILHCQVEHLEESLHLTVCSICHNIDTTLNCMKENQIDSIEPDIPYAINIERTDLNIPKVIMFGLINNGQVKFYYTWNYNENIINDNFNIKINKVKGYVNSETCVDFQMEITLLKNCKVKDFIITLQIPFGQKYLISLSILPSKELFGFSFNKYHFGLCFAMNDINKWIYKKELVFINYDKQTTIFECPYVNTTYLQVLCGRNVVLPEESMTIEILFQPRDVVFYNEIVPFYINSKLYEINITGEGIDLIIDVVDPKDKIINIGVVEIGKSLNRNIKVKNLSRKVVEVQFDIYEKLPLIVKKQLSPQVPVINAEKDLPEALIKLDSKSKKGKKKDINSKTMQSETPLKTSEVSSKEITETESKKSISSQKNKYLLNEKPIIDLKQSEEMILLEALEITPCDVVKIKAGSEINIKFKFSPKCYMKDFQRQLSMQLYNSVKPLSLISGSVSNANFYLDKYTIPFGVAVKNGTVESSLLLCNKGNLGAKFIWEFTKPQSCFYIEPREGFCAAESNVLHTVKYHPTTVSSCLHISEVVCRINGFNKQVLILTGRCEDLPKPTDLIVFSCPVRQSISKTIHLDNNTNFEWKLYPVVNGKYFSCLKLLTMEPKSQISCEVIYNPIEMTKYIPHTGYILFKLPRNQTYLYNLQGTADHPLPIETISCEIPCKMWYYETLLIHNWLPVPQQFQVSTEYHETVPSNFKQISVIPLFDVQPPNENILQIGSFEERKFEWGVFLYNEGQLKFKVKFMNPNTNEYCYFLINITATKCESLKDIVLSTYVRNVINYNLLVYNPVKQDVLFQTNCAEESLSVAPAFIVPAEQQVNLQLEYFPLITTKKNVPFEISAERLGTYLYTLCLEALPAALESVVNFETYLGQNMILPITIFNHSKNKADFVSKIEGKKSHVFLMENNKLCLMPKKDEKINVTFEPTSTGKYQNKLIFSSPSAGDFVFSLIGTCTSPKPQGPWYLSENTTADITFYNVFLEDKLFHFNIEPHVFETKPKQELIKSKSYCHIIVTLKCKKMEKSNYPVTGKLTVVCSNPLTKWVYYLQGTCS